MHTVWMVEILRSHTISRLITINHDCYYNVLNTCFHKSGFYKFFTRIYWQILIGYFDIHWKLLIRRNEQNRGKQFGKTICWFRVCESMWSTRYKVTFYIYFWGFYSLHYRHFFQFLQKLLQNDFLNKTKNDYRWFVWSLSTS